MMTRNEADERARRIWGDQVSHVVPRAKWLPGEWVVHLYGGREHYLDGNGHATCHQECADAEVQVCP